MESVRTAEAGSVRTQRAMQLEEPVLLLLRARRAPLAKLSLPESTKGCGLQTAAESNMVAEPNTVAEPILSQAGDTEHPFWVLLVITR